MTEKLKYFIINFIDEKLESCKDINFITYSFYELKVKNNLSENEIDEVLKVSRDYFQNQNYRVYFTGAKFRYNNTNKIVEPNELMVAIKDKESCK